MQAETWSVGADIGGTFTDVVALSASGRLKRAKVLTDYDSFTDGVAAGIQRCLEPCLIEQVGRVVHGTTVATNAILQELRAPVALITTAGFRDVLELRRARRPTLYALDWSPPAPLASRRHRMEVTERVAADGTILTELVPEDIERCAEVIEREGLSAVAVCLLNAHANPAHEKMIVRRLRERLPQVKVTASATIAPQIKEFERTSTTVVNAFLLPVVETYLARLEATLRALAMSAPVEIMQSDGTTALVATTAERPFSDHRVGSGGGSDGRRSTLGGDGPPQRDCVRHGGNDGEVDPHRGLRDRGHGRNRGRGHDDARRRSDPGSGISGAEPQPRSERGWVGWRVDRLDRRGGCTPGRSAQRRL